MNVCRYADCLKDEPRQIKYTHATIFFDSYIVRVQIKSYSMAYNIMQHTRHNSSSQLHVEKYLYQKTTTERGYLPLNREAINLEITGLESTGMPCFISMP